MNDRLRWLGGIALVLAAACAIVWWPGCRKYPTVTTPESQQFIKLLYTACNTKNESRLAECEARLSQLDQEGKVTKPEREAFAAIIAEAKRGRWEQAAREAFRFAEDQVRGR